MPRRGAELCEHILDVASELFYAHGLRNVGINRVIRESGVSRGTLYNHFESKDHLIEAYVQRQSVRWLEWYTSRIAETPGDPRDKILGAFDVLDCWFQSGNFRGCSVANAMVELADADHAATELKEAHDRSLRCLFADLVEASGVEDVAELSEELFVVLRGAEMSAFLDGPQGVAQRCRRIAEHLLDVHLSQPTTDRAL